jgi:hypothetical protein
MRSTGSSPSAFITDVVGSTELAARLGDARWGSCSMSTMPGSCSRSRPADPQKCGPRVRVEVGDVEAGGRRTDPELGHDVEMAVASNRGEPKGLRGRVLSERVEEREAVHTSFRKVHFQRLIRTRAREERREDFGELRPTDPPVLDVDALEHSVVEVSPHRRSRPKVRSVTVAGEPDGRSENVLPTV